MGNVFLGWPNRIDDATLSGGSWETGLPLNNLKDRQLAKVARSTDDAAISTKFIADLGQARSLRAFALANHNLSIDATWRIKLGTTSGGSDVYDSTGQGVWALTFDSDLLEWEDNNWWEGIADDEYVRHPFLAIWLADAYYSARYVTIEITDTSNPDGYVQIGRPFIGGGLLPAYNMSYGAAESWADESRIETSLSGVEFFDAVRRYRTARFLLQHLDSDDFKYAFEAQRRLGTVNEVLYVPDVSDLQAAQRQGFLGRMRALSPIEYPLPLKRSTAFEIRELL